MERLQKVLAASGVASRRKAEDLMRQGRVCVNGRVVDELGTRVDPDNDTITVDGQPIRRERKVYYLLNKPVGIISSVYDPYGRPTVISLVKQGNERIFPVGRLDYDTSGVLLLTNDGEMTNLLLHPREEVEKVYRAVVKGKILPEAIRKLQAGVMLEDGPTAAADVQLLVSSSEESVIELSIHEGRNRQVRRMCDAVGHPVVRLERIRFADLDTVGLRPGESRALSNREIFQLKQKLGMDS